MGPTLTTYTKEVVPALKKEFGYTNTFQVPRIMSVTVNVGVGKLLKDPEFVAVVEQTLTRITGQKPIRTKAKKSIAGFKLRAGQVVGVTVTLRKKRMYDFLDRLFTFALPRIRDFRGIDAKCVDAQGNVTIGFRENLPFPEIRPDEIERVHGLEVSIRTSAHSRDEGLRLFALLGFPFRTAKPIAK
ncbi:50S ribosomal protein L5 [Candidatus Uhrbacteria bacterium]|nr:50S ribosomal protein L5 [Candidatus Uhrbacteria bacterium]